MFRDIQQIHHASQLHWTVITSPARFNHTVELECTIDGVLNTNLPRKWERESRILTSKNKSTKPEKYRERITSSSFVLQILNFDVSDLGKDYTCKYGFDVYSSILSITKANFELHPTNRSLKKSWNITGGHLIVNLEFFQVYPVPLCEVVYNNRNVTNEILTRSDHVGVVYKSLVSLNISVESSCQTDLEIRCSVGTSSILKENPQIEDEKCKSDGNKCRKSYSHSYIIELKGEKQIG
ncbi:unnamed protein product [Mytilus edulis]|uniref:Ig-like domain-containing protein n=1 Tax=Mytilus edulis TaxID=6550 RepID=A0A8S3VEJ4_MYTED|nr:unnamed protein product [Mytilus edulis]